MSFKDLDLKSTYDSSRNDLVKDFYIPVLEQAARYDRITGYFNSYSLAMVAKGLKPFIENGGKMRLLCGTELSHEDLDYIMQASEIAETLSDNFLEELDNIDDELQLNHLKLLAWMINEGILEIKIGIVKNLDGYIGGILHEKIGILTDTELNEVIFLGSNNETKYGWSSSGYGNIERFKVFLGWEDAKFMKDDIDHFEEDWYGENPYLEVMDVPKAAKEGLIKIAPKDIEEVKKLPLTEKELGRAGDTRELRDYQNKAIREWLDNDKRGIFEMATGSGKTFTALNCIEKAYEEHENLITVIACPYAHLVEQWATEVENFFDIRVYRLYGSGNPSWKKDLSKLVFKIEDLGTVENAIILTTHTSFSIDFFKEQISLINNPLLLVVDEMHHTASGVKGTGLLEKYNYRLGLSATPKIYNDEEATEYLLNYFGGIVYSFSLIDAVANQFLAPYDYFPKRIQLTDYEIEEYYELTDKITMMYYSNKEFDEDESLKSLILKRKRIINNAEAKYDCLRDILNSYTEEIDHLIVFCSPQQIDKVMEILKEEGVSPRHKFTSKQGTMKSKDFDGLSEREFLVKKFDSGFYKALVAIKCLDEGVDVPSADKVIIMSSSNNPKEYIQRRGRVLRQYEGKKKAEIYDMAVIPRDSSGKLIERIVEPESIRLFDFINISDNPEKGMELLKIWGVM